MKLQRENEDIQTDKREREIEKWGPYGDRYQICRDRKTETCINRQNMGIKTKFPD